MWDLSDTIAAVASAQGGGARGVVRMSGPQAVAIAAERFSSPTKHSGWHWPAKSASVISAERLSSPTQNALAELQRPAILSGDFRAGEPLGLIPCRLFVWPTVRSYTRQPVVEIHVPGSPPLVEAVLRTLCAAGARPAGPGEFTLRAFLAGRIDLVQAEAVLGVIDAADRHELQVALAQLAGNLSTPLHGVREQLLNLLAHLEAGLDFVEEDIEFITPHELQSILAACERHLALLHAQMQTRGEARPVARVAIVGAPNVGKSSLLNALCGEQAALVANAAGTTRDYLTRDLTLHGIACRLIDTAGQDETRGDSSADQIQHLAQQRAHEQSSQSHARLFCCDASRPANAWELAQLALPDPERLLVLTKCDAPIQFRDAPASAVRTSALTGQGLAELTRRLAELLESSGTSGDCVAGTAVRCSNSLRLAAECTARARELATRHLGLELVAAEVRAALEQLGLVTGAITTDDVLDRLFSRFCIGK